MERYVRKFKEYGSNRGTILTLDSDCDSIKDIKNEIIKEYKKLRPKEEVATLKFWTSMPNRYDIIPANAAEKEEQMNTAIKGLGGSSFGMVWDTVEVSYSFQRKELLLDFKGYKLQKEVRIKY